MPILKKSVSIIILQKWKSNLKEFGSSSDHKTPTLSTFVHIQRFLALKKTVLYIRTDILKVKENAQLQVIQDVTKNRQVLSNKPLNRFSTLRV